MVNRGKERGSIGSHMGHGGRFIMSGRLMFSGVVAFLAVVSCEGVRGQFGPTTEQTTPGVDPSRVIAVRAATSAGGN